MSRRRCHTPSSARTLAARHRFAPLVAAVVLVAPGAMHGCAWQDATGTHTLVLGLGVVSTQHAAAGVGESPERLAQLERTHEAGLILTPRALTIGVADRSTLTVAPQAQVLTRHVALATGDTLLTVSPIVVHPLAAPPALGAAAPAHTPQEVSACSQHHAAFGPARLQRFARTRHCWRSCCCP